MSGQFDAFISYARSASTEETRALKDGLEQYNRNWNSARSTKVFLDDSSMSGAASLEDTITTALSDTRWMIVVLSEAAAKSPWVDTEVAWWLDNRGPNSLLLVHNDGRLAWANGDFTPDSTAVPPSLRGRLAREPRWIDMQWFDSADSAGAKDPRLADVVLQLYCPIHGLEREEAVAQNSAQVRRARRLARGAIILLSTLLAASLVASVIALQQRNRAIAQTHRAVAKQLAAQSQQIVGSDIWLSRLFAAQAYSMVQDEQTRGALLSSVLASPQAEGQIKVQGVVRSVAASADAQVIHLGLEDGRVIRWERTNGKVTELGSLGVRPSRLVSSADGRVVIASTENQAGPQTVAAWVGTQPLALPTNTPAGIAVSPSGRTLLLSVGEGNSIPYTRIRLDDNGNVASTEDVGGFTAGTIAMPDDETVVILDGIRTYRFNIDSKAQTGLATTPCSGPSVYGGVLSSAGNYLMCQGFVAKTNIMDAPGNTAREVPDFGGGYFDSAVRAVADDGSLVVVAEGDQIHVLQPGELGSGGSELTTLRGSPTISSLLVSGRHVVAADQGKVNVFNLDRKQPLAISGEYDFSALPCPDCGLSEVSVNQDGSAAVVSQSFSYSEAEVGITVVHRDGSAQPIIADRSAIGWRDKSHFFAAAEGAFELYELGNNQPIQSWPMAVATGWNAYSGIQAHWAADEGVLRVSAGAMYTFDPKSGNTTTQPGTTNVWNFSSDGTRVMTVDKSSTAYQIKVWDAQMTRVLWETQADQTLSYASFTGDHELKLGTQEGFAIPEIEGKPTLAANTGAMRYGPEVSPNGQFFLTSPDSGQLVINSRTSGKPLGKFTYPANEHSEVRVAFSGDSRTAVAISPKAQFVTSTLIFYDLRPEQWYTEACRSVGRALTTEEWVQEVGSKPDVPLVCGGYASAKPAASMLPNSAPTPTVLVSTKQELMAPTASALVSAGVCDAGAERTGSVFFTHPTWGQVVLATCHSQSSESAGWAVFNASGSVLWTRRSELGHAIYELPNPAIDASGNIFIRYNPGRFDGIEVVRPTEQGMTTSATFYFASLIGPQDDGYYRVKQSYMDCTPSCAEGPVTHEILRWDGSQYVIDE